MRSSSLLVFVLSLIAALGRSGFADEPGGQRAGRLDAQVRVQLQYLLYLPKDYDKQASWPLLLFLHGAGERGDDLELVKKHGLPKLIAAGKQFPFIVVSPQCRKAGRWEPIELVALLDDLSKKYKVDDDRIYVTGLSLGGFGTWRLAAFAPDRLAAIAPICGGGEKHWAKQFTHLPVWAFHGGKDQGVPLERSQMMINALKKAGGDPKLTIYPEAGHDSWTETYNNPKLYEWLLQQKRLPKTEQSAVPKFDIEAGGDLSQIRFVTKRSATIVDITCKSGIGKVRIKRRASTWPKSMLVRLHLSGMESFKATVNNDTLEWWVSSGGGENTSSISLRSGGKETSLSKKSDYYTEARIVGGNNRIPLKEGYFEVPLPGKLFDGNPAELSLSWIDFYRN